MKREHVAFFSGGDDLNYWVQTLEMNGIKAYVTEEHDHGIISHLWVEGKRNLAKTRKLMGRTSPDDMIALKVTRECYEMLQEFVKHSEEIGDHWTPSECLIVAMKTAR